MKMRKILTTDDFEEIEGAMNPIAEDDAMVYLGLDNKDTLTPEEERWVRAKKHKIVTSSKKKHRRISRELYKYHYENSRNDRNNDWRSRRC